MIRPLIAGWALACAAASLAAQSAAVPPSPVVAGSPAPDSASDSVLAAATDALQRGLPWRATRMLAPVVADSVRRTPDAVFLAATAASRWGGWAEVGRLLASVPWGDDQMAGTARLLLGRAAIERGADSAAAEYAGSALPQLYDPRKRAAALVVLARALEGIGAPDSAAATYLAAARLFPEVADWLTLRGAALTADSLARAGLYATLVLPRAREQTTQTEAAARERFGDVPGAARLHEALGDPAGALRLRLASATDSVARDSARSALLAFIAMPRAASELRAALAVIDSLLVPLTAAEELGPARAAVAAGVPARAVGGYRRAFDAGLGEARDRFDYAAGLARLGRYDEAAAAFAQVPVTDPLGGAAAYQRARALLRGGRLDDATDGLKLVEQRFPKDTAAAPSALVLLADLAGDDRRDDDARKLLLQVAKRFPASRFAAGARFRAAILALLAGHARQAANELDQLVAGRSAGEEVLAATYWSGRAWAQAGDSARARERWTAATERDPGSYYTGLSERRLGLPSWSPPAAADSFTPVPDIESALNRAALLQGLGLALEADWEQEQALRDADRSLDQLLGAANAFRARGLASQGIRLARRGLARGAPADARLYRLLYPVVQTDALVAEAAAQGLDVGFVAALIRQESSFNPNATSTAGARGLMQVMPDVGRAVARTLDFPEWDPALLWQPDVSLAVGTTHLADLVRQYADSPRILAAYNAGMSRVDRWQTKRGVEDPEIFVERIPFVETRDYVRIILRNRDIYRVLYGW